MATFNWQMKEWPKFTFSCVALKDELEAFAKAFRAVKEALRNPQSLELVAHTLTSEAVTTSAIEGVNVDESVVMPSICKALGVEYSPAGFTKDIRAEGVAKMMLAAELERMGAIIAEGAGPQTRYRLDIAYAEPIDEPIADPINDPIKRLILDLVKATPGINRERLAPKVGKSVETVKRAVAALIAAGKIEHRGSKKTGGYWTVAPAG